MGNSHSYKYTIPVFISNQSVYCNKEGTFCFSGYNFWPFLEQMSEQKNDFVQIGSNYIATVPINDTVQGVLVGIEQELADKVHKQLQAIMCGSIQHELKTYLRFLPMDADLEHNLRSCAVLGWQDAARRLKKPVGAFRDVRIRHNCQPISSETVMEVAADKKDQTWKKVAVAGAVGLLGAAAWRHYGDKIRSTANNVKEKARERICRQFARKELITVITTLSHLLDNLQEQNTREANLVVLRQTIKELSAIAKLNDVA